MNKKINKQFYLLKNKPIDSSLWNKDLDPTSNERRNWRIRNFAGFWVSMAISIPTFMLGATLIASGMNWWQALITIMLGVIVVVIPMILIGHAGAKYGIPFPVFLRSSFGTHGARIASLLRAFVACGWFGIFTWIGGKSIYALLLIFIPQLKDTLFLGGFIGLNVVQACCFIIFWCIQMLVIYRGIDMIKRLETWASPVLILVGILLLCWAWTSVGSIGKILQLSSSLNKANQAHFWYIFWPGFGAVIANWSAIAINIPDFTRFAESQKSQAVGQFLGFPPTATAYAFLGIIVASATVLVFGKIVWDPLNLIGKLHHPLVSVMAVVAILIATITTNVGANIVPSANDFSNLFPKQISFKMGGYITGIIGVVIFPWKLIADPQGYIFRWLLVYSSVVGAMGGIMISDYYFLRKTRLTLSEMFKINGKYTYHKGWNWNAFTALVIAIIPIIPGFLVKSKIITADFFPKWLVNLYNYDWFVTFIFAFVLYAILMHLNRRMR